MKVYDVEGWPNPMRVRMALAEKDATDQVEFIPVDVMGLEHRSPEFLAKNPDGLVPCLELDDGDHISQCNAIIEYIDAAFEGPSLTGVSAKERGQISMMNVRAERGLLDAVSLYFHNATPGLGEKIETYQCAEWGNHQKKIALKTMTDFDELLKNQTYIAGDKFSVADITAFAGMTFAGFAEIGMPKKLSYLTAWKERIAERG